MFALRRYQRIHPIKRKFLFRKWWVSINSSVSRCIKFYNRNTAKLTTTAQHYAANAHVKSSLFVADKPRYLYIFTSAKEVMFSSALVS